MNPANDTHIFFQDLAVSAVISEPERQDLPARVLFDRNSMGEAGVMTDKPQIVIEDSVLAQVHDLKAATITVTGRYPAARIMRPQPDGLGLTTAILAKV